MLLCAGTYFWHIGKHSNAKQCFERVRFSSRLVLSLRNP
jgi:hypothetical protein